MAAQLVILTGPRGSGKTQACLKLAEAALARGKAPVGLISPAVFEDGHKTAIDLLDLGSGKRRRLAERPPPGAAGTAGLGWRFDATVLAWGNAILDRLPAGGLLVLDELGPLEFEHGQGLSAGLALLDARRHRLAVAVVRPELLTAALSRWPWAQTSDPLGLNDATARKDDPP